MCSLCYYDNPGCIYLFCVTSLPMLLMSPIAIILICWIYYFIFMCVIWKCVKFQICVYGFLYIWYIFRCMCKTYILFFLKYISMFQSCYRNTLHMFFQPPHKSFFIYSVYTSYTLLKVDWLTATSNVTKNAI